MLENRELDPARFNSIEEIQNFCAEHSAADYWNEIEDLDLQLSPDFKVKLELKKLYRLLGFSNKQIEEIETKEKQENLDSRR